MTSESLKEGKVSKDSIKNALTKGRGDLFLSSSYLGVTIRELDRYIRSDIELMAFAGSIEQIKTDDKYDKLSNEQFKKELERKCRDYKIEALDIIYDIATMQPEDGLPLTAAQQDVRLKAAVQLRGTSEVTGDSGQQLILQELNKEYLETAPRIKSIRAVQIEYKTD
jgi:hypothetical protein